METYTKLSSNILTSTVWCESFEVRCIWIALLAMRDENHEIQCTIPGLAKIVGTSIPIVEEAIRKFLAPDPYSRTKEFEGRRLEEIEGGWFLLNGEKYRCQATTERKKTLNAERQLRYRNRTKSNMQTENVRNASVTLSNASVTLSNANVTARNALLTESNAPVTRSNAQTETETEKKTETETTATCITSNISLTTPPAPEGGASTVPVEGESDFEKFWSCYPRKVGKLAAKKAWAQTARVRPPIGTIIARLLQWTGSRQWSESSGQFVPHPATWLRRGGWDDEISEEQARADAEANDLPF